MRGILLLGLLALAALGVAWWTGGTAQPAGHADALGPVAVLPPSNDPANESGADAGATEPLSGVAPGRVETRTASPTVESSEEAGHRFEVVAVDALTGVPVHAFVARDTVGALHAQGRRGNAVFEGLGPGQHVLEVQGPEHMAVVHTVEVPLEQRVVLRLPQRTGLRGLVRFADARPAPGVTLRLTRQVAAGDAPGAPDAAFPTLAKSDLEGRYRFAPLPPGTYGVTAEHLGRTVAELGPVTVTEGLVDLPDVRLEAGARLELEALDARGTPRGAALIVISPVEGSALRRYTDAEGKLVLEPLPPGRYTVAVLAQQGHAEERRELELVGGLHRESFRSATVSPSPAAASRPTDGH